MLLLCASRPAARFIGVIISAPIDYSRLPRLTKLLAAPTAPEWLVRLRCLHLGTPALHLAPLRLVILRQPYLEVQHSPSEFSIRPECFMQGTARKKKLESETIPWTYQFRYASDKHQKSEGIVLLAFSAPKLCEVKVLWNIRRCSISPSAGSPRIPPHFWSFCTILGSQDFLKIFEWQLSNASAWHCLHLSGLHKLEQAAP